MCFMKKNLKWVKGIEKEGIIDKVVFKERYNWSVGISYSLGRGNSRCKGIVVDDLGMKEEG